MTPPLPSWSAYAIALGIGLLIGAERERRKGSGQTRGAAGIRTFAVVALLGAVAVAFGPLLLAVALAAVAGLVALAYARHQGDDPGLTTEGSLLLCLLLGALAPRAPALAAGLAVAVTVLLAEREWIHHFVRGVLTEQELNDLLMLAAATLVVLPLVPDRAMGPLEAINPHTLWIIVILILSIGALAHTLLRLAGSRLGLPLAGLLSGFVSSVATIGVMGARAKEDPAQCVPATAAAVLSTVATFVQMAVLLAVVDATVLRALALPLACGGAMAVLYGALSTWRTLRQGSDESVQQGRAFSLRTSLLLAATMAAVLLAAAAMRAWLGNRGLVVTAGVVGFADTHAPAVSVATLVVTGKVETTAAAVPILIALSTNTVTKAVVAAVSGGRRFAPPVVAGLALVTAATWLGWWLG
ncbi:MgtC/SapB family protein [Frateuria defendens]|uniref:MgtC/SapB family protein n=1 Tax=Frateuria defendens TaxID=2219559 RepID=UPI00066FDA60|nr:MgtC/SapB family protein [Frateuria defendens]